MTDAEILAAAAVFLGAACNAATGFGFALVAAPLLVAALPPEEAIATGLCLGITVNALTLLTEGRRAEPLWSDAGHLLAWGSLGALAGALLLAEMSKTALQVIVTCSVIAALATRPFLKTLARKGVRPRALTPMGPRVFGTRAAAGLAAGALTTTTTANGPPLLLYLLHRGVPPARMRDTLSLLFVSFGFIGLAAISIGDAALGLADSEVLAAFAVTAVAGHIAGRPLFRRLAAGHYDLVVTGLLVASVLVGAALALI